MANLSVRNLDDELLRRLKLRAAGHRHSAEAEVRTILRQLLSTQTEPGFDELAAEIRALATDQKHTPAEVLLRESRDER